MEGTLAVVALDTEEKAWSILKQLVDNEIDADNLALDFANAYWIKFNLHLKGERYQQSVTASMMKGLIEYQFANYRSIALILKNRASAGILSDMQKDRYELIFHITGGSTGANADGKGIAESLNTPAVLEAVKKMSRRQIFILILTFLVMSYGGGMYAEHLRGITDIERIKADDAKDARQVETDDKKDSRRQETINQLIEADKEKSKLLERVISKNEKANEIVVLHENAVDEILKNTNGAEYVVLQGRKITREQIDKLNKQTRRRPKPIFLDANFIIRGNVPIDGGGFNLTVENTETGVIFAAALIDPLVIEKSRPIQMAEWNSKPVRLHVRAKDKGDGPYEAEIIRVFRQKK